MVRAFTRGGAERQAAVTAAELARRGHSVEVITFHGGASYADILADAPEALPVFRLGDGGRRTLPVAFWRTLRVSSPDVVLSYLAGPNLLALLGRCVRPRPLVVWGIRSTTLRGADETRLGQVVARVEPWLSRLADRAISNSEAGRIDAVDRGLRLPIQVVPNGIDTDRWRPEPRRRAPARAELGVLDERSVVLWVGRVHPMKDLPTLLRAMASIVSAGPGDRPLLVVAGDGERAYVRSVQELAGTLRLAVDVRWLGDMDDLGGVYAAADVLVSSSAYGEGFSNVIGEAMACGLPCIGTDVGDTARLLGDATRVVPPGDHTALAESVTQFFALSDLERAAIGRDTRHRIVEDFSVNRLGERLEAMLSTELRRRGAR